MGQLDKNLDNSQPIKQEMGLDEAFQFAVHLHQANQLDSAEKIYQQLLEMLPNDPDLLHFFGMLRNQQGFAEEGVEYIKKALRLAPNYIDAENSLGNIYLQIGQPELAEQCFRRSIDLNPQFASAYANLGIALKDLGRAQDAEAFLLKAIRYEPDVAHHYQNLGNVYRNLSRYDDAVAMYEKAIRMHPADAMAYQRLTRTFYMMGKLDCCVEVLQQWLDFDPDNPTALHLLAAYTRDKTPIRASDDYVRETFDRFAASFDNILKTLDYQAPSLVHTALQRIGPAAESWELLDAGCGTGLCGVLVRPLVKRLVGVDLSAKMLVKAQARNVYDVLHEAELTAYFLQTATLFDVITCVDTFCYFGDLSEAVTASVSALKPNGWFIFTVEKLQQGAAETDFRLNVQGRYAHSEAYVRGTLQNAGYRISRIDTAVLRNEFIDPVFGLVITAQLSA
ncbi:MAG: tetratricopeptide repeat protein [Methylomonas sp.]|jgi:predicted TPR repeat methyltransferase|uniref:tetratricopeptide repeat protein n=1 Tax=Methylomonas sp. TaxID=418 RepID=UPI0025F6F62D|nr:tetratricopeptide repeat protein [Methylomonas sp.]MCK9608364.1 tetratricopeptide repeat protein [Methylomonas sp.]